MSLISRTSTFAETESNTLSILEFLSKMAINSRVVVSDQIHRTIWTVVSAMLEEYAYDFSSIIAELVASNKVISSSDLLKNCVRPLFIQGAMNWGRIVAVLAFYVECCRNVSCASSFDDELAVQFAEFLNEECGKWIHSHGGWTGILKESPSVTSTSIKDCTDEKAETRLYKFMSLALMGVGVGTLVGFMTVR